MKIIIDTNIIIDVYQSREPFCQPASKILKLCESKKVSGSITANTVTDIYYVLGKYLKDDERLKSLIQKLLTVVNVADVLGSDISKAFTLPIKDYEDALIVQCAMRTKANYIITRNLKDFENSSVPVILPQDFLDKYFPESKYQL